MFDLTNKVALITGAAKGMGKAHSLVLAKAGAKVILTDIDFQEVQKSAQEIIDLGLEARTFKLDVTNKIEIDQVFDQVFEVYKRLDILINNAGILLSKPFLEITQEEWDKVLNINLKGQFLCAQKAAFLMKQNNWGRIINISSIASGEVGSGLALSAHYAASKGGVKALTETLALELAQYNITVNAIAPGAIETDMTKNLNEEVRKNLLNSIPLKRFGKPEEVANLAVFLASEEASYLTGSTIYIDGGLLAS